MKKTTATRETAQAKRRPPQPSRKRRNAYDGNTVISWERMAGLWHPGLLPQPKVVKEVDDDIANMTDEELDQFCDLVIAKYHQVRRRNGLR